MEKLKGLFGQLHTRTAWATLLGVTTFLVVVIPLLNAAVPANSALQPLARQGRQSVFGKIDRHIHGAIMNQR